MLTKNYISYYIFIFLVLSSGSIYWMQQLGIQLPLILNHYYNDFTVIPIVLSVSLWVARKMKHNPQIQLSLIKILALVAFYIVYFEIYLPKINPRYTADFIDAILYLVGGLMFFGWHKLLVQKKQFTKS